MTREDIIRMAREVGCPETSTEGVFRVNSDDLGRFAALVAAAEREACAKLCESKGAIKYAGLTIGEQCATAIRARGER